MSPPRSTSPAARRPWLCVCVSTEHAEAIGREFELGGWSTSKGADTSVGPAAADRPEARLVLGAAAADIGAIADLLTSGTSVIATCVDGPVAIDLFDQCRRLARAEWYDDERPPVTSGLDMTQLDLLVSVADGYDVNEGAQLAHVSARTAARRLAEARATLGARTNTEAAVRLSARLEQLRS